MSYHTNIIQAAAGNPFFRKELFTTDRSQVVLMSVEPGDDIGLEAHDHDQILVFVEGQGEYRVGGQRGHLKAGDLFVVPAHTRHDFTNTGQVALKLYTVYAPPEHAPGTLHRTKAEAEEAEERHAEIGH